MPSLVLISDGVRDAFKQRRPVVALESTVITHGLPHPVNIKTALACENEIRSRKAEPATIAIVEGQPHVGVSLETLHALANRRDIEKVNSSNMAAIMAQKRWGSTTVAATMRLAHFVGIKVFATGGIGGVHRDYQSTGDISSDLQALATIPMIVVCAGAKSILDLPRTLEFLETFGVPVVGFGADEFPAFYSHHSDLKVDVRADSAAQVAEIATTHWKLHSPSAILVVVPVPAEFEIPAEQIEEHLGEAMRHLAEQKIRGKAVTPFLLSELERLSGGATLRTNTALLLNNAARAAEVAAALNG